MSSRKEYFDDLLQLCGEAVREAGFSPEDEAKVVAALVLSDSINGLRKAMLQVLAERRK